MRGQPHRIQRRRTRGWQMPDNTKYVGRPGKFGNPFTPDIRNGYWGGEVSQWETYASNGVKQPRRYAARSVKDSVDNYVSAYLTACDLYAEQRISEDKQEEIRQALRGYNLACWCPQGMPCHSDVLLLIANTPNDISIDTVRRHLEGLYPRYAYTGDAL